MGAPEGTVSQNGHVTYQNEANDTRDRIKVIFYLKVERVCYTVYILLVNAGIKKALLTEG